MNIQKSPERVYEQRGITHSLFAGFIMNSPKRLCSLSGFHSLPNRNMPPQLQIALLHSSLLALRDIPVTFKQTLG